MAESINFTAGESIPLTATTAGVAAAFALAQSAAYTDCMITNAGSAIAFIGFGEGSAVLPALTGTVNATPIAPGASIILRKGTAIRCLAICASGTVQLYFTAGQGA